MRVDILKHADEAVANNAAGIDYAEARTERAAVIGRLCADKHFSGC